MRYGEKQPIFTANLYFRYKIIDIDLIQYLPVVCLRQVAQHLFFIKSACIFPGLHNILHPSQCRFLSTQTSAVVLKKSI
jgi:hypothetical protein